MNIYIRLIKYIVRFPIAVAGTILMGTMFVFFWLFNSEETADIKTIISEMWEF